MERCLDGSGEAGVAGISGNCAVASANAVQIQGICDREIPLNGMAVSRCGPGDRIVALIMRRVDSDVPEELSEPKIVAWRP